MTPEPGPLDLGVGEPRRFTDREVHAAAARMIPVADLIAPRVAQAPAAAGRPRILTVLGLLTGMDLACQDAGGSAVHLARAAQILGRQIPGHWRTRFGIAVVPATAREAEALYACVRRLFHAALGAMDPSAVPKNHRITRAQEAAHRAADDPQRAAGALSLLTTVSNLIVESSLAPIRALMDTSWDGATGLDATAVAAFARGTPTLGPLTSTDPDAGWYVREGDHKDPDTPPAAGTKDPRRRSVRKHLFGYEATLAVLAHSHHAPHLPGLPTGTRLPSVTTAITVHRPGVEPGGNAIRALADQRERGHKPGILGADRAYNNSLPEHFQLPVRALGYKPAYDYPASALGIQAPGPGGMVLIEGGWHCPQTPDRLAKATIALHRAIDELDKQRTTLSRNPPTDASDRLAAIEAGKDQARTTWSGQITERLAYRIIPKGHPDPGGHQRYSCPAAAGTIRCPAKPASLATHRRALPLIDPRPTPGGPPQVCRQQSITVHPEAGAKHWQELPYGTEAWQQRYQPPRAAVEGANGHAKDGAFENIQNSQGRRIRGIAAQSLLLAFQIAHANTRKIDNWRQTLPRPGAEPIRRPPRRTTTDLRRWTPAGSYTPTPTGQDPDDTNTITAARGLSPPAPT